MSNHQTNHTDEGSVLPKARAGVTAIKVQVHGQDSTQETNMRLDYHDYTE